MQGKAMIGLGSDKINLIDLSNAAMENDEERGIDKGMDKSNMECHLASTIIIIIIMDKSNIINIIIIIIIIDESNMESHLASTIIIVLS